MEKQQSLSSFSKQKGEYIIAAWYGDSLAHILSPEEWIETGITLPAPSKFAVITSEGVEYYE